MRLLFVSPYYLPALAFGGPVTVASQLAEEMVRRGHSVHVLVTDVLTRTERTRLLCETINGVRVRRVRNLSQSLVRKNAYTPMGFARAVESMLDDADLLHVHDFFSWPIYRSIERAARHRLPVLMTPHGGLSTARERGLWLIKTLLYRTLGAPTVSRTSMIQVTSDREARDCSALGIPDEKIRLIPTGVEFPPRAGRPEVLRRQFDLGEREIILYVGRLLAGKGVDLLLEAAKTFPDGPAFVLVGPPENRPDLEQPGWRGKNVLLTGPLYGQALADAYAAASVFTLPSFAEGLPLSALDALAHGLPCILSNACNLPEVEKLDAGMVVESTVPSLVAGVKRMLARRAHWSEMGERGRELVRSRYSLKSVHDRYEELYRELLGIAPTASGQVGRAL